MRIPQFKSSTNCNYSIGNHEIDNEIKLPEAKDFSVNINGKKAILGLTCPH